MLYLLVNEKVLVYHCLLVVMALLFQFQQIQNPGFLVLLGIWHFYQSLHRDQFDSEIPDSTLQIPNHLWARKLQRAAFSKSQPCRALEGNSLKNNGPILLEKETIWNAVSY